MDAEFDAQFAAGLEESKLQLESAAVAAAACEQED